MTKKEDLTSGIPLTQEEDVARRKVLAKIEKLRIDHDMSISDAIIGVMGQETYSRLNKGLHPSLRDREITLVLLGKYNERLSLRLAGKDLPSLRVRYSKKHQLYPHLQRAQQQQFPEQMPVTTDIREQDRPVDDEPVDTEDNPFDPNFKGPADIVSLKTVYKSALHHVRGNPFNAERSGAIELWRKIGLILHEAGYR